MSSVKKSNRLLISFTPEERRRLDELAERLRLSRAELIRRLLGSARLPTLRNEAEIRALIGLRADLARLGNLLKLALDDPSWREPGGTDVEGLIAALDRSKDELRRKIEAL